MLSSPEQLDYSGVRPTALLAPGRAVVHALRDVAPADAGSSDSTTSMPLAAIATQGRRRRAGRCYVTSPAVDRSIEHEQDCR